MNQKQLLHIDGPDAKYQKLLMNLCRFSQRTMPAKSTFTIKMEEPGRRYAELDIFRQNIESEFLIYAPFSATKKRVAFYKLAFIGFGILFGMLGGCLLMINVAWSCGSVFLSHCLAAKNILSIFCFVAAIAAFSIGQTLCSKKDSVANLIRRARHKLTKIHTLKKVELGLSRFFSFGNSYGKSLALKQSYRECCENIEHHRDEILQLFDRIASSLTLDQLSREHLYNQAILELNDKLNRIVHHFRRTKL